MVHAQAGYAVSGSGLVRMKILACESCRERIDLFPGYLLAENKRHPRNVLVCPGCGDLNEMEDRRNPGRFRGCGGVLQLAGPARRNRCACPRCSHVNAYPRKGTAPSKPRLFAIEHFNPDRKAGHKGRFFNQPDAQNLARAEAPFECMEKLRGRFIPSGGILAGDETDRLHRWGYRYYRDMLNPWQLLATELSCRFISEVADKRIHRALATNLSDLLRYQNMLCRYDAVAFKSLGYFLGAWFPGRPGAVRVQCPWNQR